MLRYSSCCPAWCLVLGGAPFCESAVHIDAARLRCHFIGTVSPSHSLGGRQQIRDFRLEREKRALSVEATRISGETAVRTDDAVAWNDYADRIASGCSARGASAASASGAA